MSQRTASYAMLVLCLAASLHAQEALPPRPPREALLFKSGQSFVHREVALKGAAQTARLRLPAGVHGTIWLGSTSLELLGARALLVETSVEQEVLNLVDSLRMAMGKMVTLEIKSGQDIASVTARVVRLLGPTATTPGGKPAPARPQAVALSTKVSGVPGGTWVVPVDRIVGISFPEGELPWKLQAPVKVPVLDVRLGVGDSPPEKASLGMAYMAGGLAWAPSYSLGLGKDDQARLVGKAIVINDLEELQDTEVRLVVGYPNIKYARVRSGLLPEVTIDLLRSMLSSGGALSQGRRPSDMSQIMSNVAQTVTLGEPSGPVQPMSGESDEDLYIYDIGKVSLARGERAYVPFLDQQVAYAHAYHWDLPDRVNQYARFIERSEDRPIPLWHVLKLKNGSDAPWTTAPVLIRSEKRPLAQSQITYTPAGAESVVRLTQALNLAGETLEYRADDAEADRTTVRLFGRNYEHILVKGQLELRNHGLKNAPVRVRKQISGDVVSSTGDPNVKGRARGLGQINASRTITWKFDLAPGKTWKAEFTYRVLIRR